MLTYIQLALAVWRISYMLVLEDGPLRVFSRVRHELGIEQNGHMRYVPDELPPVRWTLASIFNCTDCMSMWIAFPVALLCWRRRKLAKTIMFPFALSAISVLIGVWQNRG